MEKVAGARAEAANGNEIHLYKLLALCHAARMLKKMLLLALAPLLLGGCAATLTNLTPKQQIRTADNLYRVEVAMDSRQQAMRWESIKPQVVVGQEMYPMRPTPLMTNRWEGMIPVPAGTSIIQYRYKVEFLVNTFGGPPQPDSASSQEYTLRIVDQ